MFEPLHVRTDGIFLKHFHMKPVLEQLPVARIERGLRRLCCKVHAFFSTCSFRFLRATIEVPCLEAQAMVCAGSQATANPSLMILSSTPAAWQL